MEDMIVKLGGNPGAQTYLLIDSSDDSQIVRQVKGSMEKGNSANKKVALMHDDLVFDKQWIDFCDLLDKPNFKKGKDLETP